MKDCVFKIPLTYIISSAQRAMSRADGLVQRRNVSHLTVDDREGAHGRGSDDEESKHSDEEDIDSKETRFTLMEEVLLLGLKDEQVIADK